MQSKDIRQAYFDFMKERGHAIIPSASILPENDASTLFTSSGMQPLIPYLMGEPHPAGKRLCNIQKSFRAGDIEEVGDSRHTTCFEMMGNWSLGDYFKAEQLPWFFEFLTGTLKLDPQRLYISVFRGSPAIGVERDETSVGIWQEIFRGLGLEAKAVDLAETAGMSDGRIFYYPEGKNWWSRSGAPDKMPLGEIGGPDSEVFYDLGADLGKHENSPWRDEPCHINCDCGRFIEVGNSVFIEFQKTENGFVPLKQKNVDFGGGLERLTMATEGVDNIFETDMFRNTINRISYLAGGKKYPEHRRPFEVIADHIKGATFIMGDDRGVTPANTDQGYIVRRLLRRAIRFGGTLGISEPGWSAEIAKIVIHDYAGAYPELAKNADFIVAETKKEEARFMATLEKGERMIKGPTLAGQAAFDLFQTYGYPVEMTREIAAERGIVLNPGFEEEYQNAFHQHQELSRTAAAGKFKGGLADSSEATTRLHTAAHLLLEALRRVLGREVHQKGSNITAERLRFDFSHPAKLSDAEKKGVEDIVNQQIALALPVDCREMTLEEARAYGAEGVFTSKYGEKVKVYTVGAGEQVFSREICGGPHVDNIGQLGHFRIAKEESSSSGVRRIKAILE